MDSGLWLDSLRIVAIFYLLVLALLASIGAHQLWLAYPARSAYAGLRLLVMALTFGRVRLTPLARRARRRQARRLRELRAELREWRERRREEDALARGESLADLAPMWAAAGDDDEELFGAPQEPAFVPPPPGPAPAKPAPGELPSLPQRPAPEPPSFE